MSEKRSIVAAVLSRHLPDPERWRDHVSEALASRELELDGEELFCDGEFVGWADLLEPGEAAAVYGDQPWFSLDDRGRFAGRPVGFVCWTLVSDGLVLAELALYEFRGTVGRTDTGESHEPTKWSDCNLSRLFARGAPDDLFVSRDDEYAEDVCERVRSSLADAGYEALVGFDPDNAKKPLALIGPLRKDGVEIEPGRERAILDSLTTSLFVFDEEILDDEHRDFWCEP